MSVSTGTATSYIDLLNKLVTFLTTDATLVAAGRNWTKLANSSSSYTLAGDTVDYECYLRAPGLSGAESIYLNLQAFHNGTTYYNWRMAAATGYNSAQPFIGQPGISPFAFLPLWNGSIPYTFIANGQRAIIVAQVSSVWETAYIGKFNPFGSPSQYPYPVAVGGSSNSNATAYTDTTANHQAFFDPLALYVCDPSNVWQMCRNWDTAGASSSAFNVWPWLSGDATATRISPTNLAANLDGSYPLIPARLEMTTPASAMLGELDGVCFIPGASLLSGSSITVGSDTWLAVQNTFRNAVNSFAAIKEA
jgi:hypothetical protein